MRRKCFRAIEQTFPQIHRNQKQTTGLLSSDRANFSTNPQKSETNDRSAFERFSVPISNDGPASTISSFLSQLTVVPTSSFSHFHVPTNATSTATGLTSLNDVTIAHVSATTAITTATKTQVPATRTATTNAPKNQLDKCKTTRTQHKTRGPSILHPAKKAVNNATPSLLLPFNRDNPATTVATHAQNLLLYTQIGSAITMATHAQNLLLFFIRNDPANSKLHLIVAFILRASTAQTTIDLISVSEGEHQVTKLHQTIQVKFCRANHQGIQTQLNQVTPATIRNNSFKLIDTLASKGGALCSEGAHPVPTI